MSALTFIQHFTGVSNQGNYLEKDTKDIHIGKENLQLSLFSDGMIFSIEKP